MAGLILPPDSRLAQSRRNRNLVVPFRKPIRKTKFTPSFRKAMGSGGYYDFNGNYGIEKPLTLVNSYTIFEATPGGFGYRSTSADQQLATTAYEGGVLYGLFGTFYTTVELNSSTARADISGGLPGMCYLTIGSVTSYIANEVFMVSLSATNRTAVSSIVLPVGAHSFCLVWNASLERYQFVIDGVIYDTTRGTSTHTPLSTVQSGNWRIFTSGATTTPTYITWLAGGVLLAPFDPTDAIAWTRTGFGHLEPVNDDPYLFPVAGEEPAALPLHLGSTQITGAYLGSTEFTGIYKGSSQLWP